MRSKCCGGRVETVGRTTQHHECTECGRACDVRPETPEEFDAEAEKSPWYDQRPGR